MRRPAARGILILLAIVLNGWPWFRSREVASSFAVPAPATSAPTTPAFHESIINPDSPNAMSHVASIAELPDGRLAAAWYAGSREGAGDVAIYLSTRAQADESPWSPPRAVVTRASAARDVNRFVKKVGNATVFADPAGRLWLIYVTVAVGGWSGSSLNATISSDGGATWRPSVRLTLSPFFNLAELAKNGPVALTDGGWDVPIYHELAGRFPEVLRLHERDGVITATKRRISGVGSGYQPAMIPLDATRAVAILRDAGASHRVSVTRTEDAGESWSAPERLDLPNPDSGLDAIRLSDGRLLLAFNDSTVGRESLRLALSADEGRTWTRAVTVAEDAGGDFSYPFLMQAQNGDVHLVYTWQRKAIKHQVFSAAWLDARRSESSR